MEDVKPEHFVLEDKLCDVYQATEIRLIKKFRPGY